jgi:SDR family mycofactocin-dependent oxidoreductase
MTRLTGKIALVTGAARGQGRSHAIRLAEEGADIIAIDIAAPVETLSYDMATPEQLRETADAIEALDRRVVTHRADVRDLTQLKAAVDAGVAELGGLDIVVANAGVVGFGVAQELDPQHWRTVLDIDLTGVWQTAAVSIDHLKARGGGAIVLTSSMAGLKGMAHLAHYAAAKHGVVGLMRTLAIELAPYSIRVNTVNPGTVDTDMTNNASTYAVFAPDLHPDERTVDRLSDRFQSLHALPVPQIPARDVSNAVLFLASDDARYITGVALPVDAGGLAK